MSEQKQLRDWQGGGTPHAAGVGEKPPADGTSGQFAGHDNGTTLPGKIVRVPSTVQGYVREGRFRRLPEVLDKEPPWLLKQIIPILSGNVRIDDHAVKQIRDLASQGPIIYALKYPSVYDLHFLRIRFAELALPLPAFVLGISAFAGGLLGKFAHALRTVFRGTVPIRGGFKPDEIRIMTEILQHGGAGVICLVDDHAFRDRYVYPSRDPLRIALDLQGQVAGCISVVPMFVLYDRTRRRVIRPFWESFLGDPDRPGPLRRLFHGALKHAGQEVLVGEPVQLLGRFEEFGAEESWEELPLDIRNDLINAINDRIRVNRGPEKLSRTQIKERVLRDQRVKQTVIESAKKEGVSTNKIRKRAESYVEEIAADPHLLAQNFLYYVFKWTFALMFDKLDYRPEQIEELKTTGAKGTLVIVPCHKSHLDYMLIPWLIFANYIAVPYIAAGKNLNFWPIGPLLRRSGAFFLRRTFKGLKLYSQVFGAYVSVLASEKSSMKFFIEGGRSRTGKLMPPRLGLLGFLLQAVDEGAVSDLTFIPAFVGYERVPEESSILTELSGHEKSKESLWAIFRAIKVLWKSHGEVHVRFHKPIHYRDFCRKRAQKTGAAALLAYQDPNLLEEFAYHLMFGIVQAGVITPTDLASAALVCTGDSKVGYGVIQEAAAILSKILRAQGIEFTESLASLEKAIQVALGSFVLRGLLKAEKSDSVPEETIYVIEVPNRTSLEYYRNALVNYLWPSSFLASLLLAGGAVFPEDITPAILNDFRRLRRLFSKEIVVDPLKSDDEILEATHALFRQEGWLDPSRERRISKTGLDPLECCRGVIVDMLEFYYLALVALDGLTKEISQREFGKRMAKAWQELHNVAEGGTVPSFPSIAIGNALSGFHHLDLIEYFRSGKNLRSGSKFGDVTDLRKTLGGIIEARA